MFLFGLRPTIYLNSIYVNMLRMCSFTYHRGSLLQIAMVIASHSLVFLSIFATVHEVLRYNMFLKFVVLLLHVAEYPNAALTP